MIHCTTFRDSALFVILLLAVGTGDPPRAESALYDDVWEYHLGSNTWHLLYAPDGGNAGRHKAAYFLTSRTLVRNPDNLLWGMGATMAYLPDAGKTIWYIAAQNVSPHAYEMWLFDSIADQRTELMPNGGKSVAALAAKEQVAPLAEQQTAYGAKHKKLAAFSVTANRWETIEPVGPGIPAIQYGGHTGHFDPQHHVLVVQGRYCERVWVYRHGR